MTDLFTIFETHQGRTIHKLDHYFPAYERHFGRYIGKRCTMIEIGAGLGGSAQMWKTWLGPDATIVSLDIREECLAFDEPQISVRIGHQRDCAFLASVLSDFGIPDIVVDDGSHIGLDQIASFEFLYPRMTNDGVYLVEDLHCSYLPAFDGGLRRSDTFVEYAKDLVDDLNAEWYARAIPSDDFCRITASIHLYDSMAFFERGTTPLPRRSRRIPPPTAGTQIAWPRRD